MRGERLLGVIGWPLEYTLSPDIHHAAFRAMGLDWLYLAWPVPPESFVDAIRGLQALGAVGVNLTMPHKSTVLPLVDELGDDAAAVGAVNTLQFSAGKIIGHNTDVEGFSRFLTGDAGVDARGKKVLVLGAGGAARAVARSVAVLEAGEVVVAARDLSRAEYVAELAPGGRVVAWTEGASAAKGADIIVNATPLGSRGENPLPDVDLGPGQTVVDLVYQPGPTPLILGARSAGADAWGGLGMLVHQAAGSFRIWTGQPPPLETMSAAALRSVGLHGITPDDLDA